MNPSDQILVTGASGFVGNYILQDLLHKGYQNIRAHSRMEPSEAHKRWPDQQVEWASGDLMDLDVMDDLVSQADYIIHAAGKVSYLPADRRALIQSNFQLTQQLVDSAIEHHTKGLIFVSSTAALSRDKAHESINETGVWQNMKDASDYSYSKWMAELEVWRAREEGLQVLIVAPSVVIGRGSADKGFNQILARIKNGTRYFPTGAGGFVDVRDVASFVTDAAAAGLWGEKYILNAQNLSFYDIYRRAAALSHSIPPARPVPLGLTRLSIALNSLFRSSSPKKNRLLSHEALKLSAARYKYDNQKSIDTGLIHYRPVEESLEWAISGLEE